MNYRKATISDYEAMHAVRMSVKENVLINTGAVTFEVYQDILENKGCGWVCEDAAGRMTGFSIVDLSRNNIWALFVHPDFEGLGVGRKLHELMLDWSFKKGAEKLWLTTDSGTRAENFYLKAGWHKISLEHNGELRFEITKPAWLNKKKQGA